MGIVDRIIAAADRPTGVRFVGPSVAANVPDTFVPWREIHDEARVVGAALQARGLVPGDHVAILGPTSRQLITVIQGCWLAGLASMVLPLPMRMGSLDAFIESTRARIRHGDAKLVLIDELLAAFYERTVVDPPIELMADVLPGSPSAPSGERLEIPGHDPERLVILQYTSGSTSEPKGVMIPDRVLAANIDASCSAADLGESEVMVSWLPLYHDMGLVGFLSIPMTNGCQLVQAAPQDFLAKPGNWMQWISDWGGTATAGPNFSWVLATRALGRMHGLDLSQLTLALSGAEPIDPPSRGGVRRRRRTIRIRVGERVSRFRHGRAGNRRSVPATRPRHDLRLRRPSGAGARQDRQTARPRRRRRRARCPAHPSPRQAGAGVGDEDRRADHTRRVARQARRRAVAAAAPR